MNRICCTLGLRTGRAPFARTLAALLVLGSEQAIAVTCNNETISSSAAGVDWQSGDCTIANVTVSNGIPGSGGAVPARVQANVSGLGTLLNNGTIASDSSGFYAFFNASPISALVNNGTIHGYFTGVFSNYPITSLTNNGTISGGYAGIDYAATIGTLVNNGLITGGSYAIYSTPGTIINTGAIAGDMHHGISTPLNITGGTGSNFGILTGYDAALSSYNANYAIDSAGATVGTITNLGSDVNFHGNNLLNDNVDAGTHTVTNNGNLKIANTATALAITGNFVNAGTYTTSVAGMTGYSMLSVSGNVSLGGTAAVNVIGTPTLTAGGVLANIITAGGTVSGSFSSITDNSYLYDFTGVYGASSFSLAVVAAASGGGGSVTNAVHSNGNTPATGAAMVLDAIVNGVGTAGADWSSVTTTLGQMGSSRQVSGAASQTLPLLTGAGLAASSSALSGINRVIQARMEGNRGLSSGDEFFTQGNLWLKPFGSWARQDTMSGIAGYKAGTAGLAGGADARLNDRANAGMAFAYARATVDSSSADAPSSAKIDLFQLIGYGSYTLDASKELNWQVDAGRNNNKGNRSIGFMGTSALSDYDSLSMHAAVGLGWNIPLSEKTTFLPSVRADYTRIKDDAYSETGAGVLNLNMQERTSAQMLWSADAKIRHQLDNGVSLSANAGLGYDSLSQRATVTAAFAGAPGMSFVTYGVDPSPWIWHAGLGITRTMPNGVELTARYDTECRTGFSNHTASLKLRWMF